MIKLMVFDLDNTLAKIGKGISDEDLSLLKRIEQKGVRIAICSGKPTYYLCGFMRQVELRDPILVGENGAVIQFGVDLPPRDYRVLPYSDAAKKSIAILRKAFDRLLPELWYQPNQTGLTPFPATQEEFDIIAACIEQNRSNIHDVTVYRHVDSFDITPNGINKFAGLAYLGELTGISREETVAVGDGVNDYPMFAYAGHAVGVRVADKTKVHRNFESSTEALQYLLSLL
jgi:HAD superfamily hydrolase (TIGR01484 family)